MKQVGIGLVAGMLILTGCGQNTGTEASSGEQEKKKKEQGQKQQEQEEQAKQQQEGEQDDGSSEQGPSAKKLARNRLGAFGALPKKFPTEDNPITQEKIDLGRKLYYEDRISKARSVSCNTCHPLSEYGDDGLPVSRGHEETKGPRNAPTVYNAAGKIAQFWDGRAADVEEQAKGPVLNPKEMAMPEASTVEKRLKAIEGYSELFQKAFPDAEDPVTFDHMAKAIGAFERKLVTPSRWDQFIKGDDSAITEAEAEGFNTFVTMGCTTCHNGELVGGNSYQKLGLVKPWKRDDDLGRYKVTNNEADKRKFLVPTLRNVTETAPYFHTGQVKSLKEAVRLMGYHQLGKDLSDSQIESIITWLETLTGELPQDYIEKPTLPGKSS